MNEQHKVWDDYITESRIVLTESEKWAKDEAMKIMTKHLDGLYDKVSPSEADAFKSFITKMKKIK